MNTTAPLLQLRGLQARYGDFQALFGVDLSIKAGQVLAIIGANGAGKSTILRAITGLNRTEPEQIQFDGHAIGGSAAHTLVAQGIAMVPEGRRLFPSLSVRENLLIGARVKRPGSWSIDRVYELFPILRERAEQAATSLSGGQQQMVAIGRALMSNPRLLLCDELSLGLAPTVIKDIYDALPQIRANDCAVIIVEQDITQAMRVADHVICLQEGRVTLTGAPSELSREQITRAYFGV